jgi:CubicO group peptidase (beta-lactamase class C family)
MGLGFILQPLDGDPETIAYTYGRHASRETFGHGGSQCASAWCDPVHGLSVAWVANGMPGEVRHQKRAKALNAAIYEDLGLVSRSEFQ